MEEISSRGIVLSWDPETRHAVLRFERETRATGHDAQILVDAMRDWIGADGKAFALLGDGNGLTGLDAEYRSTWANFLMEHKDEVFIAFYNMNPIIRVAADMFRIGSGLKIKAFGDEGANARAWLRKQGFEA